MPLEYYFCSNLSVWVSVCLCASEIKLFILINYQRKANLYVVFITIEMKRMESSEKSSIFIPGNCIKIENIRLRC